MAALAAPGVFWEWMDEVNGLYIEYECGGMFGWDIGRPGYVGRPVCCMGRLPGAPDSLVGDCGAAGVERGAEAELRGAEAVQRDADADERDADADGCNGDVAESDLAAVERGVTDVERGSTAVVRAASAVVRVAACVREDVRGGEAWEFVTGMMVLVWTAVYFGEEMCGNVVAASGAALSVGPLARRS